MDKEKSFQDLEDLAEAILDPTGYMVKKRAEAAKPFLINASKDLMALIAMADKVTSISEMDLHEAIIPLASAVNRLAICIGLLMGEGDSKRITVKSLSEQSD